MRSRTNHRIAVGLLSILFAVSAAATTASAEDSRSIVVSTTLEVNDKIRDQLLSAFLNADSEFDPVVESLSWDLLLNETRLLALGERRPLLQRTRSPEEIGARLLEERTGHNFDPFAPLAGKTLFR